MADKFMQYADGAGDPARRCQRLTPHATNALPFVTKAIRAPSDGVIVLRAVDDTADVDHPVFAGERIDVRASHIRVSGTTVTGDIIGYG
tara:strand:- start:325 stop:591 length:267 start_codon:yes stop_codon:yes gene_type:complete